MFKSLRDAIWLEVVRDNMRSGRRKWNWPRSARLPVLCVVWPSGARILRATPSRVSVVRPFSVRMCTTSATLGHLLGSHGTQS
ncbi:hypothetical protein PanWU01x14_060580, partial [Parasponia andersonii]